VYHDPREEHGEMAPYIWAWAAFDHMRNRHLEQKQAYPDRAPVRGMPFEGIEGLSAETQALAESVGD